MVEKYKEKDNVSLYNFPISDKDGYVDFYDHAQSTCEFFSEKGIDNSINLGLSKINTRNIGITECFSMDTFLRKISGINPDEIDFIKIDTENSDLFILENMIDFLVENKIRPFVLFENNYRDHITDEEAIKILEKFCQLCGYESVNLNPGDNLIIPKNIN